MNKQQLLARREYFDMVHGVTIRAIGAFNDAELDFRRRPPMRTPRALIFHIYSQEKVLAEAAQRGQFTMEAASLSNPEDPAAAPVLKALVTVADLQAYADACHQAAGRIFVAMSEDEIPRSVESPIGNYPSWAPLNFSYFDNWHPPRHLTPSLRPLPPHTTI